MHWHFISLEKLQPPAKLLAYNSLTRPKKTAVWCGTRMLNRVVTGLKEQRLNFRFIFGKFKTLDSAILLIRVNNISKLETGHKIARIKLLHFVYTASFNPSKYLHPLIRPPGRATTFSLTVMFARTSVSFHFSPALPLITKFW